MQITQFSYKRQVQLVVFTHRCSHSVSLGIDEASNLCEITVALSDKLDSGGLHEERVVRSQHSLDALFYTLYHHRLPPAVHELPHLIISGDLCLLHEGKGQNILSIHFKI